MKHPRQVSLSGWHSCFKDVLLVLRLDNGAMNFKSLNNHINITVGVSVRIILNFTHLKLHHALTPDLFQGIICTYIFNLSFSSQYMFHNLHKRVATPKLNHWKSWPLSRVLNLGLWCEGLPKNWLFCFDWSVFLFAFTAKLVYIFIFPDSGCCVF